MKTKQIEIPYSTEQWNSLVDSCLYGLGYGMVFGEHDFVKSEMKLLGYTDFKYIRMDDKREAHIVEVEDNG